MVHLYRYLFSCLPWYHPSRVYFFSLHFEHIGLCSLISIFLPGAASDYTSSSCSTAAMCYVAAPIPGGVVGALTCGALVRKRDTTSHPFLTLGGHVPTVPGQGLDLVALLVYVEPAARYTLLRGPAIPGFAGVLLSHTYSNLPYYLRS